MKTNYWVNKNARAEAANEHTREMERAHKEEIKNSINETHAYFCGNLFFPAVFREKNTKIILAKTDSVSAVLNYNEGKTAVLNFASFKEPGGMFLAGSSAQEESLCMESYLFNVLVRFKDTWYADNNTMLNGGLYQDRALYSPNILFERNDAGNITKAYADVITCACPNKSLIRYGHFSETDNSRALEERIDFVLGTALANNVDTLVLGAFGCGVFSQDAEEVARIFEKMLANRYNHAFAKVVFAVPCFSERDINYEAFEKVFASNI